ncbi:Abi family protein [Niabella hibiscisoli]|uniref:Abi family protein n=1 Tax=Niabella hibiscisoli TaxID=1825928 RepID=UPI001F10B85E|nr:Abi family protein [Niabella hibiscisoli]MCH5719883.1 Abi family protein [Niabella hibiscisoli]
MKFQQVRLYLSAPRIDRYLIATGNKQTKAVRLYKANLKIAQAFHPLLGVLEVTLRNRLNTILSAHFTDPDWIINQKTGFMVDASLTHIDRRTGRRIVNDFLKSSVEKSERRFRRLRIPITTGKIIADQVLGFWTDLFEVHHYRLLLGRPIQVFGNLPSGHGRREVCDRLNTIRQFRNRVNHNEPLCFNVNVIDFTYVEDVYQAIIDILTWIDPELINWIKNLDSVQNKIANAKTI